MCCRLLHFAIFREIHNQTAEEIIQHFAEVIGEYDKPKCIVRDASSNFMSSDFKNLPHPTIILLMVKLNDASKPSNTSSRNALWRTVVLP